MASNNKTFYVERTDFSLRIARVRRGSEGDVIEEVREVSSGSREDVRALVQTFSRAKPGAGNLLRAHCAIYPATRLLRTASLKDRLRPGEVTTWENVVTQQLRVNPSEYLLHTLGTSDGLEFDGGRSSGDFLLCGAPRARLLEEQDSLVEAGIYPVRMELGSVAAIGLLLSAMRVQGMREPSLALEIGADSSHVLILNGDRIESARPLPLGMNAMIGEVRRELGLRDEEAAKKLFYSDSFDFREMGPRLVGRLVREVQSMVGFYEVQTGQSLTRMLCTLLPERFGWLTETFASSLGMAPLALDPGVLLACAHIDAGEEVSASRLLARAGLYGMMLRTEAVA